MPTKLMTSAHSVTCYPVTHASNAAPRAEDKQQNRPAQLACRLKRTGHPDHRLHTHAMASCRPSPLTRLVLSARARFHI